MESLVEQSTIIYNVTFKLKRSKKKKKKLGFQLNLNGNF